MRRRANRENLPRNYRDHGDNDILTRVAFGDAQMFTDKRTIREGRQEEDRLRVEWEALRTKASWLPFDLRCFPICPDDSIGTPRFAGLPKRSYLLFVPFVFFVVLSFIH